MNKYTNKENKIIKQCNEGPFHTLLIDLTNLEFNNLVSKLIKDDDIYTLSSLVSIYLDYDRSKIIDYLINKGDHNKLLDFLNICNDFESTNNKLNLDYIVNKLIENNNKEFIKNILESNNLYFLDNIYKDKLISFIEGGIICY